MHPLIQALTPLRSYCPVVVSCWDGERHVDQWVTDDPEEARRAVAATGHPEDYLILPYTGPTGGLRMVSNRSA